MVCIHEKIEIHAPAQRVWECFTDLTCWADWNSVLTEARSGSEECFVDGGSFQCCVRPYGLPVFFEARVEEVEPHKRIVWTGARYLIRSWHEFLFEEDDGGVRLVSREILRGLPVTFGGLFFPVRKFRRLTRDFLEGLKRYAEEKEP